MGHPVIENKTLLAFEALFSNDPQGCPAVATLVQAAYSITEDGLFPSTEPPPLKLAGESWFPDAPESSYKYEPQFALSKRATDVALIGHAHGDGVTTESMVSFQIGPLRKTVRVTGDRYWVKSLGAISMTLPAPFEQIPLVYERAFGGWDRSHPDPYQHARESRNPVGTGFRAKNGNYEDGVMLPNLEDPGDPVRAYGQTVTPAGFGFISPHWVPRASYAGTYDDQWRNERMPLLPDDFDPRFFNAASPGLAAQGYLRGDEEVIIKNASPGGLLRFRLPGAPAPTCKMETAGRNHHVLPTILDTVIVNTDESLVLLLWRAWLPLRTGPHDVVSIEVVSES